MSFSQKIATLGERIPDVIDHLDTEEATKNALVLPFIAALGYDVFNPKEVLPEFTADVGTKKGEKVDYAISRDGQIILIIECKKAGTDLDTTAFNQLYRYFSVTQARVAILTNGIEYRFFSDLDESNKMDTKPFLILDLLNTRENLLAEIRNLSKDRFDIERVLSSAHEMKILYEIKTLLRKQIEQPHEDLVRFFFSQVNPGARFKPTAKETFSQLVQKALQQFISDSVNERLRSALRREESRTDEPQNTEETPDDAVVTTQEEIEAYHIVKAILARSLDPSRISYRDAKSYMAILLDDNNRKAVCRLWFNRSRKYLGLFDDNKKETRVLLSHLNDIYKYDTHLKVTAMQYDESSPSSSE